MSKKSIALIIFILLVSLGIISVYTTFAFNEEISKLSETNADYNLIYSLKDKKEQEVIIEAGGEKYVDITLNNTYEVAVKYGMCYKLLDPKRTPTGLSVTIAPDSKNGSEAIIDAGESKTVSVKITNNSEYNVDMLLGALIGFENGNIDDLLSGEEILIR